MEQIYEYVYLFKCLSCRNLLGKEITASNDYHIYEQLIEKISIFKFKACTCGYCGSKEFEYYDNESSIFHKKEGHERIIKHNRLYKA